MKAVSDTLLTDLERQLDLLHLEISDPLELCPAAIQIILPCVEKLKSVCLKHTFCSADEEIFFFRYTKPKFVSKLLFYNTIYNIESRRPISKMEISSFYKREQKKIEKHLRANADIHLYHRRRSTHLDHIFFIRQKHDIRLQLDNLFFLTDNRFSTSHDHKIAEFMACEQVLKYLAESLDNLTGTTHPAAATHHSLKWTASKVALVELLYALHTDGVFNNGKCELKDVANFFSKAFDIDLTQFHRTFSEISSRKSDRTKFLTSLNNSLLKRMEAIDI